MACYIGGFPHLTGLAPKIATKEVGGGIRLDKLLMEGLDINTRELMKKIEIKIIFINFKF